MIQRLTHRLCGRVAKCLGLAFLLWGLLTLGLWCLDRVYPLTVSRYHDQSLIITDKHGEWLQVYLSQDDKRRIATTPQQVTADYLRLLIHYEDQRFYRHHGIDWWAILRASGQNIAAGKVVSGASTLTMQTAKLLHPRPRTFRSKLIEIFRAWQLERQFSKPEILAMYLTLAPAGGNIEGLQAAAYHYLAKPLDKLSLAESAWLVALPQSPTKLTANNPTAAVAARNKVLKRAYDDEIINALQYQQAISQPLRLKRIAFPLFAPHISQQAKRHYQRQTDVSKARHFAAKTTLDKSLQIALNQALTAQLPLQHPKSNLAAAIMDNAGGHWLAYVGSADFFANARQGQVDMLTAVRSPGSALKPFISLLAFDWLHYQPQTTIDDTPIRNQPYQPSNYDADYQGRITLAEALQRSRNIPAVRLMAAIKPEYFADKVRQHGLPLYFPVSGKPNLAVALGGVGIKGIELAQLYRQLANCAYDNSIKATAHFVTDSGKPGIPSTALATQTACWQVTDILRKSRDGQGRVYFGAEPIAFKTGTAYGWRDRWIFAYSKDYTIVLWSGRADGQFAEQRAGAEALIPLLRQVVARLPSPPLYDPQKRPQQQMTGQALPLRLRHVGTKQTAANLTQAVTELAANSQPFSIVAPLHGGKIEYQQDMALNLQIAGGKPPFIYLLNEQMIAQTPNRQHRYDNAVTGSYRLIVIDSEGHTAGSQFQLLPTEQTNTARRAVIKQTLE